MKKIKAWLKFNYLIPVLLLSGPGIQPLTAQDTITLEFCYQQIQKTYPLVRQASLIEKSSELRTTNLNKNYLPQFNINGSATWQNEVTEVVIPLPANLPQLQGPVIPKDQYKLTLDVSESIYDGNVTNYQKKLEKFNLNVDKKSVDANLYLLKDQVNQFYFSILLTQQNIKLLRETKKQLESKLNEVESAVKNGAMLRMNADLIRAEIIKLEQNIYELSMDRLANIRMLSELITMSLNENTSFKTPVITIPGMNYENKRIEYEIYGIQRDRINLIKNMVTTKWNPKFWAFGQFGFGRPGYNFLSSDIAPMAMVGAKLTWNPWNWNANKNEKKIYDIQSDILKNQQETFDKNLRVTTQKNISDITKLSDLIIKDQELIDLRAGITQTASSQLTNGVITSSDYILRVNDETQARMGLEIRKIQLIKAKINYLYNTGKL
ncbi:MAG: TolC family protein [Bacteroidales bacterium]|jgi:outer membrane protein TolC|nr:TolC family protein [Bacteroidales bacterium]